ncbi:MAG: type II glyceraldehyde-3-phosphate dehydrogenase [Candidatus Hodarchaeales archaeon]|jgi:glyceraldehyde-3-phosphate dehydrogenase (NAD(P))
MKVKVGIIGYGVIGKRIADAVVVQPDMELVGIADVIADARLEIAKKKNYPIYVAIEDFSPRMIKAGFSIVGSLKDLVTQCDVIIDCTPKGIPENNMPLYEELGIKLIVQGGENHNLTNFSFSTLGNYKEGLGKEKARVVSCNTTGLVRVLSQLDKAYGIDDVFATLVRRASDPVRTSRGPINGCVPVLTRGSSHQGIDVTTVMPDLKGRIQSLAVAVSMTLSHIHMVKVKLANPPESYKDIVNLWQKTPRIIVENGKEKGLYDTAQLVEYYRDLGRPRYDRPENFIFEDTVGLNEHGYVTWIMDIHMESIPIPENIDCIRAMMQTEIDPLKCMYTTDKHMGIAKDETIYKIED